MTLSYHRGLIEDLLRSHRNRQILFLPNTGNAGDALINVGSMACFRRLGVGFRAVGSNADVAGETVVLGGGGNFVPAYNTIARALASFKDRAKEIILLPHTVRGHEELLAILGSNVTIVCRDMESYRHVSGLCHSPTVLLAHDMAFHLDAEEFLFEAHGRQGHQDAFTEVLERRNINLAALQAKPVLHLTRADGESARELKRRDLDLSAVFALGTAPGTAPRSAWCFLEFIRTAPPIVTDRLHVGIGAALLGKTCALYDNSYGKNAAVFTHSLKYHFRHVGFVPRGAQRPADAAA
jgi:exopolysaccharide biosynthesis predicted pyruvyltransferase EpsI